MSRFARNRRVFFFEEAVFEDVEPHIRQQICASTGVHVIKPVLQTGTDRSQVNAILRQLLNDTLQRNNISSYLTWYYTPMAMEFTGTLDPSAVVYDCMDELSAFAGAPRSMLVNEEALFRTADLVFTGGASLYESKRKQHGSVHLFPSSVDKAHFATARAGLADPVDQESIPNPRIGYAGVIDERMDLELVRGIAAARPDWHFVFLGPIAKISPDALPQAPNLHWLGMKAYAELPAYFGGWQIGFLPFALNDATRFISPTKTPEYLSAGLHVISTPIRDVVTPYGQLGLVSIAENSDEFVKAAEKIFAQPAEGSWAKDTKEFLDRMSWDRTWSAMDQLIEGVLSSKTLDRPQGRSVLVSD
ncbi:MAG: glycosyltransferase family 1 protein [Bryobacteraceae bacterium]